MKLNQTGAATVTISYSLHGLTARSAHGFHIHASPISADGNCLSAGPHFNPFGRVHGGPDEATTARHVGDLGNIVADADGNAVDEIVVDDGYVRLFGSTSVIGKSIVLHALTDDNGRGEEADSLTTGHAGGRIACGNIVGLEI